MISSQTPKRFCREDISLIENYDKAIADESQIWHCHHRLETHKYKDRTRAEWVERDEEVPMNELKALGLYYNRPAKELIFLVPHDHRKLHKKCRQYPPLSEDHKKKISEASAGEKNGFYGKKHTEEARNKMQASWKRRLAQGFVGHNKGKPMSDETKRKLSEAKKGKSIGSWYNNGIINVRRKECPEGFVPGMLKK